MSQPEHQHNFDNLVLPELAEPEHFVGHLVLHKRFSGDNFTPEECEWINRNGYFVAGAVAVHVQSDPVIPLANLDFEMQAIDESNALTNLIRGIFSALDCTPELEADDLDLLDATIVSQAELADDQSHEPAEQLEPDSRRYQHEDAFKLFYELRNEAMGLV